MARKNNSAAPLDSEVEKELEKALSLDLGDTSLDDSMDFTSSLDDLEAQISQASDELAREAKGTASQQTPKPEPKRSPEAKQPPAPSRASPPVAAAAAAKPAAQPKPQKSEPLRPIEAPANASTPFTPANDDRQKDYRAFQQRVAQTPPNTVGWIMALLSVVWVCGGIALAQTTESSAMIQPTVLGGVWATRCWKAR